MFLALQELADTRRCTLLPGQGTARLCRCS